MKTIKTEQHYLVVGETSPIYQGDYILNVITNELTEANDEWDGQIDDKWEKVIGHLPLNNSPHIEGVPLLMGEPSELESAFELSLLPEPFFEAFELGYKAAQQKGCFTLNQMKKAIKMARECSGIKEAYNSGEIDWDYYIEEIIAYLQPRWEYEVMFEAATHQPAIQVKDGETYLVGNWKEVKK